MATQVSGFKLSAWVLAAALSACAVPGPGSAPTATPPPASGSTPAPDAPVATTSLVGTEWVALAIHGAREVTGSKIRLRWVAADQITGTGGCNGFRARAGTNLATLQLGPMSSTGRACLSLPWSQEDLFIKALELTRKARLERDQLILMDDAGKQLVRFQRAAPSR